MIYAIEIRRKVAKAIVELPTATRNRVEAAIDALAENPRPHGCKKLSGSDFRYRVRVAEWRILYDVLDDHLIIQIVRVAHRREAYR